MFERIIDRCPFGENVLGIAACIRGVIENNFFDMFLSKLIYLFFEVIKDYFLTNIPRQKIVIQHNSFS